MNVASGKQETPQQVDKAAGYPDSLPDSRTLNSPLGAFFEEMKDVPFEEWTDLQMGRSIRQGIYIEQLVPCALAMLKTEPLAGGYYDGDLLESFTHIPSQYWEEHPDQKSSIVATAKAGIDAPEWSELSEHDSYIRAVIEIIASGTIPKPSR